MSDQDAFGRAVMRYERHCEKSGESFQLPDRGRFLALPGGDTAWALVDDDEKLIAIVWNDDDQVTTDATAQIVELEYLLSL